MMARYDRIAPLAPPDRDHTFPGWTVFLDLEDDDRDEDRGRRARLRFLALRPLHRLLIARSGRAPNESIRAQLERLREELGHLPPHDTERDVLRSFISEVESLEPERCCSAAFRLAEEAARRGHLHGAEEAARTGLELAEHFGLPEVAAHGHRVLAVVLLARGQNDAAMDQANAAVLASEADRSDEWIDAVCQRMQVGRASGMAAVVQNDLATLREAAGDDSDVVMRGRVRLALCDEMIAEEDPEAAAEIAWAELEAEPDSPEREALLDRLGVCMRQLGMFQDAERVYLALADRASSGEVRTAALAQHALMAAIRGDRREFGRRRLDLIAPERTQGLLSSHLGAQIALGRGCVHVEDDDCARLHLRAGLELADIAGDAAAHGVAAELLEALEARKPVRLVLEPRVADPGATARRVAALLASAS